MVGGGSRSVQFDKVEAIRALPEPITKSGLRGFLGAVGFYRGYPGSKYSQVALPLTDLTRVKTPTKILFNDEHRSAFQKLKQMLCEATALQPTDYKESSYFARMDQ